MSNLVHFPKPPSKMKAAATTLLMVVIGVLLGLLASTFLLTGCGDQETTTSRRIEQTNEEKLQDIRDKLLELYGQITSLTESDFSTCTGPNVSDQLVQNVCKIAQASTLEAKVELKNSLNTLAENLNSKLSGSQSDIATLTAAWSKIYGVDFPLTTGAPTPTVSDCQANNSNSSVLKCVSVVAAQITSINSQITTLGSQITTINTQISAINTSISGVPTEVLVGSENVSYGPVYESLIRQADGSRINAYVNGEGSAYGVASNPLNATNGSSSVIVTANNSLSNGNYVKISGCGSGRGFTAQNLYGVFPVSSVTGTTFVITLSGTATSGGTFGGTTCIIQPYTGSGMTTIWQSGNAADSAVRTTSQGSKAYNWTIMKPASGTYSGWPLVCYDKTVGSQTFSNIATSGMQTAINAAASLPVTLGNLVCK